MITVSLPLPVRIFSGTMPAVMVSLKADPFTVSVSVPMAQLLKLQPDMSSVPPLVAMLTTKAFNPPLPKRATVFEILPLPNWSLLNVAVETPVVLAKAMPSMLRNDAALRSMLLPGPAVQIWMVSPPPPPLNESPAFTWLEDVKMNVSLPELAEIMSTVVLAVRVLLPPPPPTSRMSLPPVQLTKFHCDRSIDPPTAILMSTMLVPAVPLTVSEFEILPAPNWALLKTAVELPDALVKAMPSMLRKPFTPSDAAPSKLMLPPAVPIWRVSKPPPPSYVSPAPTSTLLLTMRVSF